MQFDDLLDQTGDLLAQLQLTAKNVNRILGDEEVVADLKGAVKSFNTAEENTAQLIATAQGTLQETTPRIQQVFDRLNVAAENAALISDQLREAVELEARPGIRSLLAQTQTAAANLNDAILQAQALIQSFSGTTASVNETLQKVGSIAEESQELISNLNQASAELRGLAQDKQLQEDLRTTLRNTAEASEQAKQLLETLNRRFGGVASGPTPEQKSAIPDYGTSINALWKTNRGDYRLDANYTFAGRGREFYRIGARDIGEDTGVNLQAGSVLDPNNAWRYGLYGSRIAVGYDRQFSTRFRMSADLFRPNDPQMEIRGVYGITGGFGLYGGLSDIFDDDKRDLLLGVQYRK